MRDQLNQGKNLTKPFTQKTKNRFFQGGETKRMKMNKFLASFLAFALIFTLVAPAAVVNATTLSDVQGTEYEEAVATLSALDILAGFPDGTFKPNDTITREQFATVVVKALGYDSAAASAAGQTKFSDVPAAAWSSGYINLASSLGVILGHTDGTFKPADPVTFEQAVTMTVRALGYEPAALELGGYPTGFLVVAAQNDITDGVTGVVGLPAPRGVVAQLVNNSLDVPKMIQVGFGSDRKFVVSGNEGTTEQTLLTSNLKLDQYKEKRVTSVNVDKNELTLETGDKFVAVDAISVADLENRFVTVTAKKDVAFKVSEDSTTYYDFFSKFGDSTSANNVALSAGLEVQLKDAKATYELATPGAIVFKLNEEVAGGTLNKATFNKVVVFENEIRAIERYTVGTANTGIVKELTEKYIDFLDGNTTRKITNLDNSDFSFKVFVDNKMASLTDVTEDMYVQINRYDSNEKFFILATSKQVSGELTRAEFNNAGTTLNKLTIGGTRLDATSVYVSKNDGRTYAGTAVTVPAGFDDFFGENVVAYLNAKGEVVAVKAGVTAATTSFYGFAIGKDDFTKQIRVAKEVDGEVKEVVYPTGTFQTGSVPFASLPTNLTLTAINLDGQFYKFDINSNGEIVKVNTIINTVNTPGDITFNKDNNSLGNTSRVFVDDNTSIFVTTTTGAIVIKDDLKVYNWNDINDSQDLSSANVRYELGSSSAISKALFLRTNEPLSGTSDDVIVGFATAAPIRVDKDHFEYTITTMEGSVKVLHKTTSPITDIRRTLVAYELNTSGKISSVTSAAYDAPATVAAAYTDILAVSGSLTTSNVKQGKFVQFGGTGATYLLNPNAVVLEKDGSSYNASNITAISNAQAWGLYNEDTGTIEVLIYEEL